MPVWNREDDVLRAVNRLGPDCRASDVQERLTAEDGREASFGQVFTALYHLVAAGRVAFRLGDACPARGGGAPRLYTITKGGSTRLSETMAAAMGGSGRVQAVPGLATATAR